MLYEGEEEMDQQTPFSYQQQQQQLDDNNQPQQTLIIDYDSIPIHSQQKTHSIIIDENEGEDSEEEAPPEIPDELLQDEITQVLIRVYGEEAIKHVHSPKWAHRIEGIKQANIKQFHPKTRLMVVDLMISDKVPQVYLEILQFFEDTIFEIFNRKQEEEYEKIMSAMILHVIRTRVSDANQRVRQKTSDFIMEMCKHGEMERHYCTVLLLKDRISSSTRKKKYISTSKGELTYLQLLTQIAREFGFRPKSEKNGFNLENVVPIALLGVENKNIDIRRAGADMIAIAKLSLKENRRIAFDERFLADLNAKSLKFLKSELETISDGTITVEIEHIEKLKERESAKQRLAEAEVDMGTKTVSTSETENAPQQEKKELSEKDQQLVDLFGEGALNINSKQWKQREFVIENIKHVIAQADSGSAEARVKCCFDVLNRGLNDNVPQVYICSTELLEALFSSEIINSCTKQVIQKSLSDIVKVLIGKTGDMNSKIQERSQKSLVFLSHHEKVTMNFVNMYLMEPIDDYNKNWRTIVGRLNVIQLMVTDFGMSEAKGGLSVERVMTFCVGAFSSPNAQTRTAAIDCIVEVYKHAGDRIRSYLREQNNHILQELKRKVVKEARNISNSRTNSAPIHRITSVVAPMKLSDEEKVIHSFVTPRVRELGNEGRPQSFDSSLDSPASIFRRNQPSAKTNFVSISSINTTPKITQATAQMAKGHRSRFIFS